MEFHVVAKLFLISIFCQNRQRYLLPLVQRTPFCFFHTLIDNRLSNLDTAFIDQLSEENEWPRVLPEGKHLYNRFRQQILEVSFNIPCACCACIFHDRNHIHSISLEYTPLSLLSVNPSIVPYDFSTGIPSLDQRHILVEKQGIHFDPSTSSISLTLCNSCAIQLDNHCLPSAALANYRWLGEIPDALQGLTWIEERLIARAHISGMILRLERQSNASYLGIKGHAVLYPQDTRTLLDILPLPPSRLPDMIRVVWTGKSSPTIAELRTKLSVRTKRVYDALLWLCRNNEDYKNVIIDHSEFAKWPPVYVVTDLLDCMGHISENVAEQIARAGPATEDADDPELNDDYISTSGILDTNNISQSANAATLRRLSCLT